MEGYVLDTEGQLFVTHNGSESWQEYSLPIDDAQVSTLETASAGLRFLDDSHGMAVLHVTGNSQSKIVAFHTADGGVNWVREDVIESPMFVSLYLSHDATYQMITNMMDPEVILLQRIDENK